MTNYLLSPQAQVSLRQISDYTLENHGEQQRKKYLKMLRDKMRAAAQRPEMGKHRDDIKLGYFCIRAEKHRIYYRISDSHIEIIDVLHQSMEPTLHL